MERTKILILLLLVINSLSWYSCTKMDDYKKFLESGPIRYPGKVGNVVARPGDGRLMLKLPINGDVSVNKLKIFSNNGADSLELPVPTSAIGDTLEVVLSKLNEAVHGFQIYTYDNKGNKSLVSNAVGTVYGAIYKSSLSTRDFAVSNSKAGVILSFPVNNDTTQYITRVKYTNISNVVITKDILPTVRKDTLADCKDNHLELQTFYLPGVKQNSIDTFYSPVKTVDFNRFAGIYKEEGTLVRGTGAPETLLNTVVLTAVDAGTAWAQAGINIFNNTGITYRITLNADNTVVIGANPGATVSIYPIGPGSSYDPVSKKFTLNYEYLSSGAKRTFSTTMTLQ